MSFLSPLGFLGLLSLPVLLWLWRLATSHRRVEVPSLIPFEQLLRRQARRRTRLAVTWLFWIQLALLLAATLALMQPVFRLRGGKTILAILDTSASMEARLTGPTAFERASHALRRRFAQKFPTDQAVLVATSPLMPVLAQPTGDAAALNRALDQLRAAPLGGDVGSAVRMGRALVSREPDEIIVATDEPRPEGLSSRVQWIGVGAPLPNIALVGLDAQGPLCALDAPRLIATVQNFSAEPAAVAVEVTRAGAPLARATVELASRAQRSVPLLLPDAADGDLAVKLTAAPDALRMDNEAHLKASRFAALPIVLSFQSASLRQTMTDWLGACPALRVGREPPADHRPFLLITDQEVPAGLSPAALLRLEPPAHPHSVPMHWIVSEAHPLGAYLAPIGVVSLALNPATATEARATPVVSALLAGRNIPLVLADEQPRARRVIFRFDPSASRDATAAVVLLFNSLRWLMGRSAQTAEGLFNPLESNLIDRTSTWRPSSEAMSASAPSWRHLPVTPWLLRLVLGLLILEWWLYSSKGKSLKAQGSRLKGNALTLSLEP